MLHKNPKNGLQISPNEPIIALHLIMIRSTVAMKQSPLRTSFAVLVRDAGLTLWVLFRHTIGPDLAGFQTLIGSNPGVAAPKHLP